MGALTQHKAEAEQQQQASPGALLVARETEMTEVMPTHVQHKAWLRQANAAVNTGKVIQTRNGPQYQLAVAAMNNPQAFLTAIRRAASLGLVPGTEQFYLTPRKVNGQEEILGIIGYQGYIELIYNGGHVSSITVDTVHENDGFEFVRGRDEVPIHTVDYRRQQKGPDGEPLGRGKLQLVYAFARMHSGAVSQVIVLDEDDIALIKSKAQGTKSEFSPWNTHTKAMWLKGLALDTPIPTPTGWSTMGALQVGDQVFDMVGQPVHVTAKSTVKNLDCYRVTLANGASIVCDAEHRWLASVGRGGARRRAQVGWDVLTAEDLFAAKEAGKPVVLPVAQPLATPPAELPIDPWVLGYWLGNGDKNNGRVTCHIDHCDEVIAHLTLAGYSIGAVARNGESKGVAVTAKGLLVRLRAAGVLQNKHVPAAYLRASQEQRLALLQGLVDSDGSLGNERGQASFANTNKGLAEAVAELARSLGETVIVDSGMCRGFGKEVLAYRVRWQPTVAPVTLATKLLRFTDRIVPAYRTVKAVERIESVPTQCIAVDAPTRTYLAGVDMVPTHNSAVRQLQKWVPWSVERQQAIGVSHELPVAPIGTPPPTTPAALPPYDGHAQLQSAPGRVIDAANLLDEDEEAPMDVTNLPKAEPEPEGPAVQPTGQALDRANPNQLRRLAAAFSEAGVKGDDRAEYAKVALGIEGVFTAQDMTKDRAEEVIGMLKAKAAKTNAAADPEQAAVAALEAEANGG